MAHTFFNGYFHTRVLHLPLTIFPSVAVLRLFLVSNLARSQQVLQEDYKNYKRYNKKWIFVDPDLQWLVILLKKEELASYSLIKERKLERHYKHTSHYYSHSEYHSAKQRYNKLLIATGYYSAKKKPAHQALTKANLTRKRWWESWHMVGHICVWKDDSHRLIYYIWVRCLGPLLLWVWDFREKWHRILRAVCRVPQSFLKDCGEQLRYLEYW